MEPLLFARSNGKISFQPFFGGGSMLHFGRLRNENWGGGHDYHNRKNEMAKVTDQSWELKT